MKNLVLTTLLIFVFAHLLIAQNITVYGFLPSQPDTEFLRLGHLDPITGNLFDEDSISPVTAYALGSSTFDAVQGAYMFIGVDTAWDFRLYTRSILFKETLSDPQYTETLNDLQYDMNSMNTYGMGSYVSDSVLVDTLTNWWMYEYATRFMKIDQDSGTLTELNLLPDISAFPAGASTYDANNGRYIVNAYDTAGLERLVILDSETGDVLSKDPIGLNPGDYLNNLEYNNEDDKIYGFYRGSSNTFFSLISLDPDNDYQLDTIYIFNDLQYFFQGGSVLHQASQSYIMFYIDTTNTNRIAVIDVTTGMIMARPTFSESFAELQVDNTEYAIAKYHGTVDLDEETSDDNGFAVFPNPVSFGMNLSFHPIETESELVIYDINGRAVVQSHISASENRINTSSLLPGLYLATLYANGTIKTQKFIVN